MGLPIPFPFVVPFPPLSVNVLSSLISFLLFALPLSCVFLSARTPPTRSLARRGQIYSARRGVSESVSPSQSARHTGRPVIPPRLLSNCIRGVCDIFVRCSSEFCEYSPNIIVLLQVSAVPPIECGRCWCRRPSPLLCGPRRESR